jgi:hypothetical protein
MLITGVTHPELPTRLRFQGGQTYGAFQLGDQEEPIDHPEFNVYRLLDPVLCLSVAYPEEFKYQEPRDRLLELTAKYFLEEANEKHQLGLPPQFIGWLREGSLSSALERRIYCIIDRKSGRLKAMRQADLYPYQQSEITVRFEYPPL